MNGWLLAPLGLLTWIAIGFGVGLLIGPALRQCSQELDEIDAEFEEGVAQPVDSR